jgi:dihydroorotase
MSNPTLLVTGATLPDGSRTDILIEGTLVTEMGLGLSSVGATKIEAEGLIVLPGLVDLHTHLREPGLEQAETVLTGTQAAAMGGFTSVFAMANTQPVADTAGVVEQVLRLGEESGYATVRPIGAVTRGLDGLQLADLGAMAHSRAAVRVFSDDGKCVFDPLIMRRALEYVKTFGGVIAQHAQEPRLTVDAQMNEGEVSARLGLAGWPAVAEESIIARDVLLAEHTRSRLHICHLSTAGSVDVIRWAKKRGINVTAEVTPHHLLLTDDNAESYDARFKVNPPLRRSEDVLALREALADGTIDIVATDHAPHPVETKDCEWAAAAFGMVGLESALSVVQTTMLETGLIGWEDISRVLSETPARIGGLSTHGKKITVGIQAELVLVDPSSRRNFSVDGLAGLSHNSPYLGLDLSGQVVATIHQGYLTAANRKVVDATEVSLHAEVVRRG